LKDLVKRNILVKLSSRYVVPIQNGGGFKFISIKYFATSSIVRTAINMRKCKNTSSVNSRGYHFKLWNLAPNPLKVTTRGATSKFQIGRRVEWYLVWKVLTNDCFGETFKLLYCRYPNFKDHVHKVRCYPFYRPNGYKYEKIQKHVQHYFEGLSVW